MSDNPLEDQAQKLLAEARSDRTLHEPWQRDVYRYCMPWRRRPGSWQQVNDQDELFDSTAIGALSDFASDMQLTFTPPEEDWLNIEPSKTLSAADAAMIAGKLQAIQDTVFAEIRRSNFYEASQESYADLGTGTCAICIQDLGDLTAPLHCQAVPITDLLMVRGVYGGVDFKAREIPAMKLRDVPPSYPRAALSPELAARIGSDPSGTVCVRECWWRLWDQPRRERWQYALLVDDREVDNAIFEGAGSCSLITARWRTDSTTAWGIGPLYVVLPTIKTLDQLGYLALKQLSFAVDPAGFYDNDSVINLENGLSPGDWVPRAPGSKVDWLTSTADFDTTFFSQDRMQDSVKRSLYQDGPVQTGDTPPTATQWTEEKARVSARMGAPFGRMTSEWQIAIFQRFVTLLQHRGTIPKDIPLSSGKAKLRAQSPLARAKAQQDVVKAAQLLQTGVANFGPQMQLLVDAAATFANFQKALGDKLVAVRSAADIQTMVQQAAQAAAPPQPGAMPALPQGAAAA